MTLKKTIILGGGESGTGAAVLAKKQGLDIFVSDNGKIKDNYRKILIDNNIKFEDEKHTEAIILNADEIIKSPGIPDNIKIIKSIKEKNIPIISEIEFASRYTKAKKICITGSNGKTTTTELIYHILKTAGFNVGIAGNVGKSFAMQVAENNYDYYVIEISSFQLEGMFNFKAEIAILMNITPDHLDRYNYNFQEYVDSKFRICNNQTSDDYFIYCYDDKTIIEEINKRIINSKKIPFSIKEKINGEGGELINNNLIINIQNKTLKMTLEELALQGKHNVYNSMAAGISSKLLSIRKESIKKCLTDFKNIEHRLEFVAEVNGIKFINDSKATNINSSWYALESTERPIIWIAGGKDKGNDYELLKDLVKDKVKAIICLGLDNKKIISSFSNSIESIFETKSAKEAVDIAYNIADKGDVVLLSPACASFDLFIDYQDRGNKFKKAVSEL